MTNIKIIIEYDGARYLGWQRLGDSDRTIQGKIENVISEMVGSDIKIIGSGRTDAGTHARGQVANFITDSQMELSQMKEYINHYLPRDIVVKELNEVHERFHSRYNVIGKKYVYYIWNDNIPTVFNRKYSFYYPEELDFRKIDKACDRLIGTRDFIGFSSLKKSKKSTVRNLEEISIEREGDMLKFIFIGDGFLYNMVRIIVGTLLEVGTGAMEPEYIDEIFKSKTRSNAGITVPSHGLFLEEVYY